jgi:hypothetical protein
MRRTHSGFRAVAVAVALVAGSELRSQTVSPDSSAVEVAASLRRDGHAGKALLVLTQAGGRQPQQVMDEVADTLVAIAVSFPGNDASGASTRAVAQTTLLRAAKGESGAVGAGIGRGIPYAGAADRFIRIAETAQDVGIRFFQIRPTTFFAPTVAAKKSSDGFERDVRMFVFFGFYP